MHFWSGKSGFSLLLMKSLKPFLFGGYALGIKVKRKYLGALFSLLLIPGWHSFPYIGNCALTRFYFCKSIIQPPGPHVIWVNLEKSPVHKLTVAHWGKNPLFIQKFPWFWYFKNVNFVKIEISEMWILWKMRFQKCEFCENWDFRNVNSV